MFSYFEPNSLNNSFGKIAFQILAKIEWRKIKIGYLAAVLKRYKIFIFSPELSFL